MHGARRQHGWTGIPGQKCTRTEESLAESSPPPDGKETGIELPADVARQWEMGKRRALIVGISDYEHLRSRKENRDGRDKAYDLEFAHRDAEAVAKLLETKLAYHSVQCLTNAHADDDAITLGLSNLLSEAGPLDSLFIFFSGHGFPEGRESYFMWEEFLKNFPNGKFAAQARESLAGAQQAARDWAERQAAVAEEKAFQKALKAARDAADPDEAVKPWDAFLKEFPAGKLAPDAKDSLAKARQAATDWHGAEYTQAMAEANQAKDAKDFRKASEAVAVALRHRPNDAAALALQKRLVPTLAVESTPAGPTVEIQNPKSKI